MSWISVIRAGMRTVIPSRLTLRLPGHIAPGLMAVLGTTRNWCHEDGERFHQVSPIRIVDHSVVHGVSTCGESLDVRRD
jgi:hypothetical protein